MRTAITGGIAEGKSTVLGYLEELGYSVDSADRIAREVFESPEVQSALGRLLGLSPPVAADDLRRRLEDPQVRRRVNHLTHPRILERMEASAARFIEVPLLFEACLQARFARVWVVTCGESEQLRRLSERLGSEEAARALLSAQLPTRAKIPFADVIIRTIGEEISVKRCVSQAVGTELR